jgi:hypothetical protein
VFVDLVVDADVVGEADASGVSDDVSMLFIFALQPVRSNERIIPIIKKTSSRKKLLSQSNILFHHLQDFVL